MENGKLQSKPGGAASQRELEAKVLELFYHMANAHLSAYRSHRQSRQTTEAALSKLPQHVVSYYLEVKSPEHKADAPNLIVLLKDRVKVLIKETISQEASAFS